MSDASRMDDVMALATIVAELIATLERAGVLDDAAIAKLLDDALHRNAPSEARTRVASIVANLVNALRQNPV